MHDVTQTTVIVPHLQDEKLRANRMKSLNKKMNNLERLFGYRRPDPSGEKIERQVPEDLIREQNNAFGVQLSFQYQKALE